MNFDEVSKPKHYNSHPSGIEVIEITENLSFCLGNFFKYVLRSPLKNNEQQDLQKALWYIDREIKLLNGEPPVIPQKSIDSLSNMAYYDIKCEYMHRTLYYVVLLAAYGNLRKAQSTLKAFQNDRG